MPSANATPGGALRLTFRYEGDRVELVSSQRVQMILPPSHPLDAPISPATFAFEVRDAKGGRLYSRIIHSPIRTDVEVFERDGSIRRAPVERPSGTFVLLIPDLAEGESLALLRASPDEKSPRAREIVKISLRPLRGTGDAGYS